MEISPLESNHSLPVFQQDYFKASKRGLGMNRYIISLPASVDLQAIADYFAVENVEAGERLLYVFNQKCQQLVSCPNMK